MLLDLTAPAVACPPLDTCLTQLPSTTQLPRVSPAHGRTDDAPQLRTVAPAAVREIPASSPALDLTKDLVQLKPKLAPGEVEMPAIWATLRDKAYSRMPTYEQDQGFKVVLAPVVVSSPSDTVPGLGVAGDF